MSDGIFTQPGPDGIFGRHEGPPQDASSPVIDSDGVDLRETLVAVFPSPGHMRVARAVRDRKTGVVEKYEEFREPTPQERAILAQQGVFPVSASAPALSQPAAAAAAAAAPAAAAPAAAPAAPGAAPAPPAGTPWLKLALAAGVGAAALWATQKWVMPMVRKNPEGEGDEGDDGDDAE